MSIWHWLARPKLALARARYWLWERANPDKPWLCPGTVAFCERHLTSDMTALEFGSGRSTRWFAARVRHLTSVEHHADWHTAVSRQLADAEIANVDYRLVSLDHPEAEPERDAYTPLPEYVAVINTFADGGVHLAVIDGHYRTTCVRHVLPKIAPGGYLLVDDVNLWPTLEAVGVPAHWSVADDSTNGLKRCVVWLAPAAA